MVAGVLVLVHAAAYAAGIGMQADLSGYWQFLDPELLRTELVESLWYLHSQPPGFNLLLGITVKVAPGAAAELLHAIWIGLGLALAFGVLEAMLRLGVGNRTAAILTCLFVVQPAFVLYEHWVFQTLPCAVLLLWSVLWLESYLRSGAVRWLCGCFLLLMAVALIRSMMHVAFPVLAAILLVALCPGHRRRIVLAALVPVLVVASVYGKNLALFGRFEGSSWLGMHVARLYQQRLPTEERRALIEAGVLTPLAEIPPFSPIRAYPAELRGDPRYPSVRVLHDIAKQDGSPNYHHLDYVRIARVYEAEALAAIRRDPLPYLRSFAVALAIYVQPASGYLFLAPNRARLEPYATWIESLVYLRVPGVELRSWSDRSIGLYLTLALLMPAAFLWAIRRAVRAARDGDRVQAAVLALACFEVAWVSVVGNLLEVGENHRFRYLVEPLCVVLLGVSVRDLLARRRAR